MVHNWTLQQRVFGGVDLNGHFLNVKVFNPYAPSNQKTPLSACYRSHEKRKYDQRIRGRTRLFYSSTHSLLHCWPWALKPQQAISTQPLLSAKWNQAYSLPIMWSRCHLAFSLLQSSVMGTLSLLSHLGIICPLHNLHLTLSREALLHE